MTTPSPIGLQPPLRTEEFEALYELIKQGTVYQDMQRLLVYETETIHPSVLVHLAEQFDVLGYKGWLFADTEEKQRNLILDAVILHLRAGTPSSILLALEKIGVTGVTIIENPKLLYDGRGCYDGSDCYNGRRWDRFLVQYNSTVLDADTIESVNRLIDTWKNARSNRFFRNPNLDIPFESYI